MNVKRTAKCYFPGAIVKQLCTKTVDGILYFFLYLYYDCLLDTVKKN